ncbi:MAG: efflux RND transporter periplasmic adaptor subunit [Blastocatellales bacterium]|nr:efflux RND transporter periplasmic adaptor subunit [Blastocatellales bacterium]
MIRSQYAKNLSAFASIAICCSALVAATACSRQGAPSQSSGASAQSTAQPAVQVVEVQSLELDRQLRLPGELQPFQDVALYAKLPGFVEEIPVDRGSQVRAGQLLVRLRAPELDTQRNEAEAKVTAAQMQSAEAAARIESLRAQKLEAEARLAAESKTYERLKAASATPGVVAGNELDLAARSVDAAAARVRSWNESIRAAEAQVRMIDENIKALRQAAQSAANMEDYLRLIAPFAGVVTERNAHRGSFAAPNSAEPLLRLQQVAMLRLVVAVPEAEVSSAAPGATLDFTVPSWPGETFSGRVVRLGRSLDAKTRTMPVELDVENARGRLAPGMYAEVAWPSRRPRPSLFVPPAAVATTTERIFVIRIRDGAAEWIDVKRGAAMRSEGRDLVEVFGDLAPGDRVAARATDELRAGTRVTLKPN